MGRGMRRGGEKRDMKEMGEEENERRGRWNRRGWNEEEE